MVIVAAMVVALPIVAAVGCQGRFLHSSFGVLGVFFFLAMPHGMAGTTLPRPGIEPVPPALEVWGS